MNYSELKKENRIMHKGLGKLSDYRMTDVSNYIRELGVPSYHGEIIKNRFLKDMTEAEKTGEKPDRKIGSDYKKYVDELRHRLPEASDGELKLDMLRVLAPMFILLVSLKAFYNIGTIALSGKSPVNTIFTVGDISFIIMLLSLSMVLLSFISQTPQKSFVKKRKVRPVKGKEASPETKEKISEAKKLIYIGFTGLIIFLAAFSVWLLYKNAVILTVPTALVIVKLIALSAISYFAIRTLSKKYESYDVIL